MLFDESFADVTFIVEDKTVCGHRYGVLYMYPSLERSRGVHRSNSKPPSLMLRPQSSDGGS